MKDNHRVCSTLWLLATVLSAAFLFLTVNNVLAQAVPPQSPNPAPTAPEQAAAPARPALSYQQLGDLHVIRKEYEEAVVYYKRALENDPHNAACLNSLGMAYLQLQQFGPALSSFKKSLKANRNFAPAVHNMGVVYHERKQYGKAIKAYSQALTIDPQMAVAYASLGYAYFAVKRYPEAMDAFQKAVALDPTVFSHGASTGSVVQDRAVVDHALFDFLLAKMYAQAGNLERCVFHLKKARDEGYKSLDAVKTDPAFAAVAKDPAVLALIEPPPASTGP